MYDCLKVTHQVTRRIETAKGVSIREGDVLKRVDEDIVGVVLSIRMKGDRGTVFECVGDIILDITPGWTRRVTNQYDKWEHVPHDEQTYRQRRKAWSASYYDHDEDVCKSRGEGLAINGIMALLPDDIVDAETGPWPDSLEDALNFLTDHLENITKGETS